MNYKNLYQNKWTIALIVVIANIVLRFFNISNHSYWFDEIIWIDIGEWEITKIVEHCRTQDPNPPLYPIILHYWVKLFGISEIGVRALAAISVSLAAGVLYIFAHDFFNKQTAIFASLMFFTSNELFYYSQEARPYALIILFAVLSNFAFFSLIKKPNFLNAILLGAFNAILFYLHLLTAFCILGQVILFPILIQQSNIFIKKDNSIYFNYNFPLRYLIYYLLSWLIFFVLFIPWKDRFIELMINGGKNFWLPKPTYNDFKHCIYDYFNSKELYQIHIFSFVIILAIILLFKKLKSESISIKPFLFALFIGPVVIYLNYAVASYSPIFLKRYVLFTIIGFILLYSYVFSLIKMPAILKLILFTVISVFSFISIKMPRETTMDYKNAIAFIKKNYNSNTLITTDQGTLFAYYFDKEKAWKIKDFGRREQYLFAKHNVFSIPNSDWCKNFNFSGYSDIYYTSSFEHYTDPQMITDNYLRTNFLLVEEINSFVGIKMVHFKNKNFVK